MGLFAPFFLAGLVALALPLWLHLLRQFKRTPQPFSSLMFFERQIQSSSKHRRLRYLRLLALRMLLLALLALLFADPFIYRASTAVKPKTLTVIALDCSFSMRYRNRLADAKTQAAQFVNGLSGTHTLQVMALASHAGTITQPESDKGVITNAIAEIEPTDDTSSYGEFARALRVMEQATGLALDVHLFTDAQQTSMPAAFTDLQLGPNTALTIHEIGTGEAPNFAVQTVSVPPHIFDGANVRLATSIAGWETKDATRKVSVLLDGKQLAAKDVAVPPSGRAEIEFTGLTIPFGAHKGEVRIEPHDDLPNDDSFLFSVERSDPRRVLFLYGEGRSADSFFYKTALDASPASGLRVQPEVVCYVSSLDLSPYPLIVLNDPANLDRQCVQQLTDYVTKGGSLLIGVGSATARSGTVPISGNRVSSTSATQQAGAVASEILPPGTFDNVRFFSTPRIYAAQSDRIMARFADGSPLLFEHKLGEGKVMIFATTFNNSTSDFPVHASFLPFVAASGAYLTGVGDNPPSLTVGDAIALRQSQNQSASADVMGPDGRHEFPLSDATRIMTFKPAREGYYDVHTAGGKRALVAVHADRRESNLAKVPPETLILWRNTSKSGTLSPDTAPETSKVPFSLWRYILFVLLIAAVVESIFATRYLSEERQAT